MPSTTVEGQAHMLIGELARRSGVGAKTLRFYERRGLLDEPPRTPAGYRDYPEDAVDRVRFIKAAQSAGLTLAQIADVIAIRDQGRPPCAHVVDLLDTRAAEIETRIDELRQLHADIKDLRRRSEDLDPATCSPDAICEVLMPVAGDDRSESGAPTRR